VIVFESVAAVLVGLAVVSALLGPLLRAGAPAPATVEDPEEFEETAKGMALAALREIEFDRATGKLSDQDYAMLNARYTAEALAVLRAEPAAAVAPAAGAPASNDPLEELIAARVRTLTGQGPRCPACGPRPESDALFCSSCGRSLSQAGCQACGTPLVAGSRFCESCGASAAA
jgi:hypothetical protein